MFSTEIAKTIATLSLFLLAGVAIWRDVDVDGWMVVIALLIIWS